MVLLFVGGLYFGVDQILEGGTLKEYTRAGMLIGSLRVLGMGSYLGMTYSKKRPHLKKRAINRHTQIPAALDTDNRLPVAYSVSCACAS